MAADWRLFSLIVHLAVSQKPVFSSASAGFLALLPDGCLLIKSIVHAVWFIKLFKRSNLTVLCCIIVYTQRQLPSKKSNFLSGKEQPVSHLGGWGWGRKQALLFTSCLDWKKSLQTQRVSSVEWRHYLPLHLFNRLDYQMEYCIGNISVCLILGTVPDWQGVCLPVSCIPTTPKSLNTPIQMHGMFLRNFQRNLQNTGAKSSRNASPNVGHYEICQEHGFFIYGHIQH